VFAIKWTWRCFQHVQGSKQAFAALIGNTARGLNLQFSQFALVARDAALCDNGPRLLLAFVLLGMFAARLSHRMKTNYQSPV
jgi:hypothetical protein